MENITCTTCGLSYDRSNKKNHELINTQFASTGHYYCQQCKKNKLADKQNHLGSNERKLIDKIWLCKICERDKINRNKSSDIKSKTHIKGKTKKHIIFRINKNFTDPGFDAIDNKVEEGIEEHQEVFLAQIQV